MPHVVVKMWPGKSEAQKQRLAEAITREVMDVFNYDEASVSVAMQEIPSKDWAAKVYRPDILECPGRLYKKPGYTM
ncbi:MAG TPA: tautomerase family protein [Gammaproteobacteria bacterium]|nr:tautomerase family protein [Gammaproteobacteria bacterium]